MIIHTIATCTTNTIKYTKSLKIDPIGKYLDCYSFLKRLLILLQKIIIIGLIIINISCFSAPTPNYGPLSRGQPHLPNINHLL